MCGRILMIWRRKAGEVTEQDKGVYCLCRPERLLELAWRFIVYDAGEKKIARYQQYFTVKSIVARVRKLGTDGRRLGGVVWHTQGSGKSLTMVMLAQSLALERGNSESDDRAGDRPRGPG